VPIAAIVGGILGQTIGARPALIGAGVGAVIAAMSILVTKVPRFKELPPPSRKEDDRVAA